MAAAQADFAADTSGFGSSLKMATSQVDYVVNGVIPPPLGVPISMPESTDVAISSPSGVIMFSAVLEQANCNSYRIAMRTANASANFLGVLVVGSAWCPPCQAPALIAYGAAKAAYVGAAYGLNACLELDPYG